MKEKSKILPILDDVKTLKEVEWLLGMLSRLREMS